jgi:hypothetical protein
VKRENFLAEGKKKFGEPRYRLRIGSFQNTGRMDSLALQSKGKIFWPKERKKLDHLTVVKTHIRVIL